MSLPFHAQVAHVATIYLSQSTGPTGGAVKSLSFTDASLCDVMTQYAHIYQILNVTSLSNNSIVDAVKLSHVAQDTSFVQDGYDNFTVHFAYVLKYGIPVLNTVITLYHQPESGHTFMSLHVFVAVSSRT